jgi:hypothetical protein
MSHNERSEEKHSNAAELQILESLCEWYHDLKKKGSQEFTFDTGIFRRATKDGGFGLQGWDQAYVDSELAKIRISGKLESIGIDKYRLSVLGKKYCEMLGP